MLRSKGLISFVILLAAVLACVVPGISSPDAVSTSAAETVIAGLTQNATEAFTPTVVPTSTWTSTPTLIYLTSRFPSETPTLTNTPVTGTPSFEPTTTSTPPPVEISVTRPTHCRSGPGKSFEIVGSLLVGMKVPVIGRDATNQFFYIPNPYVFTDYCWVSGKYAEFEGNPLLLPVVISPPTPTTTGTAAPTLEFKLQGGGFQSCNGAFWMNIKIASESQIPFESVKVEILDKDKGVVRALASNSFAAATGCSGLTVSDQIVGGMTVPVSSAKFDYNIKGHLLRAYVTVCAQDDQQGTCATREIPLTP